MPPYALIVVSTSCVAGVMNRFIPSRKRPGLFRCSIISPAMITSNVSLTGTSSSLSKSARYRFEKPCDCNTSIPS